MRHTPHCLSGSEGTVEGAGRPSSAVGVVLAWRGAFPDAGVEKHVPAAAADFPVAPQLRRLVPRRSE
jgi:hypothetical protein